MVTKHLEVVGPRRRRRTQHVTVQAPPPPPKMLTPKQVMDRLPIGRNKVYELLSTHQIPSVRIGQKYLIREDWLQEFLDREKEVS